MGKARWGGGEHFMMFSFLGFSFLFGCKRRREKRERIPKCRSRHRVMKLHFGFAFFFPRFFPPRLGELHSRLSCLMAGDGGWGGGSYILLFFCGIDYYLRGGWGYLTMMLG